MIQVGGRKAVLTKQVVDALFYVYHNKLRGLHEPPRLLTPCILPTAKLSEEQGGAFMNVMQAEPLVLSSCLR